MSETRLKTRCERCGTCCMKGGPALHKEDMQLLQKQFIARESLITIRKWEPVILPDENRPVWTRTEIIKLKGSAAQWACIFYDQHSCSCSIYRHRPLECVLLKCWDTRELQSIAGKNLLNRFDIITADEPVANYILEHERECSLEFLGRMNLDRNRFMGQKTLTELNELVNRDLQLRAKALNQLNLNLDLELFYFGRPLFTVLGQFSLLPSEVNGKIIMAPA